ncbi:MAG: M56 family metallopeptidase, partial [Planctomycetia bacterium]|nr:M56 family metallopeptidase [Planctomycetia bacterium]
MTLSWLITTALTNAALATLLALVALAISRLFRSPALTHLLWIVVLLKLLTPPLIHVPVAWKLAILPEYEVGPAQERDSTDDLQSPSNNTAAVAHLNVLPSQPAPTSTFHQGAAQRTTAFAPSRNLPVAGRGTSRRPLAATLSASANSAITCLPAIWLSGAAVILMLAAYRAWRFLRFLRIAGDIDAALASRLASLARQTKLPAAPKLIVVQGVISPLLWGIGSSTTLIFPARLAHDLSQPECDALLLHELAHYSRGDQWVRLIELLSQVAFWWHPIVWWAGKEIEAAEEQCCDAWVIQHRSATRRTYAEALLATIDFLSDQPELLPPAASGLGDVPFLKLRLNQIMRGETAATLHLAVKLPVLVTALILLPLGPTSST